MLVCASVLLASDATAQIDASGPWLVHTTVLEVDATFSDPEQWTQIGTALTSQLNNPSCVMTGTIDTSTGQFEQSGCPSTYVLCAGMPMERSGTVAADGRTFTGSGTFCSQGPPSHPCYCYSIELTGSRCGNGVVDSGEECDDGNGDNLDGCSDACTVEQCFTCTGEPSDCTPVSPGAACDDGDFCTTADQCDGAGHCTGGAPPDCDDGEPCTEDVCQSGACVHRTPQQICNQAARSQLLVKDRSDDGKDVMLFKWLRGTVTLQDLGDPTSRLRLQICLYAGTAPALVISQAVIPAGPFALAERRRFPLSGTKTPSAATMAFARCRSRAARPRQDRRQGRRPEPRRAAPAAVDLPSRAGDERGDGSLLGNDLRSGRREAERIGEVQSQGAKRPEPTRDGRRSSVADRRAGESSRRADRRCPRSTSGSIKRRLGRPFSVTKTSAAHLARVPAGGIVRGEKLGERADHVGLRRHHAHLQRREACRPDRRARCVRRRDR